MISDRYSECVKLLDKHGILSKLKDSDPEFVGSIPISVDLPDSDIDIICNIQPSLVGILEGFSHFPNYMLSERNLGGVPSLVCRFHLESEKVEIVAQAIPTRRQISYLHLLIEKEILEENGENIRKKVLERKGSGKTTEESFVEILDLEGKDPYAALLEYGRKKGTIV
ncbi:DUF4269 domain-containing protein [Leptospira wolffii]|uniref:DUF4269 domain-containing protein n=1 Tax=Leptospira wolffii TaxID=409998 RepID=UPI0003109ADB|nr:DUF4269 domain-containing protein [Leptospira wolffii]EPG66084.1 PF14091 domain protein [Leptospira wolffii serovar Khorat str. Khorat-H2]